MNHDSFSHGAPEGLTTEEAAELANVAPDPRAAFEAAMAAAGYQLGPGRYRDGTYRDSVYEAGWAMWQAAAAEAARAWGLPNGGKPLPDEELRQMWRQSDFRGNGGQIDWFCEGVRSAERAHGIGSATKAPRWWRCDTHGPGNATAWGCPECVREMRAEIRQLRLAEEGAKTAFGHVVDSKRALEQEIAKLQYNLRAAHDIIRRYARANQEPR